MNIPFKSGYFKIYSGPMHSGKTFALVSDLLKMEHQNNALVIAFKPNIDNRRSSNKISAFNNIISYTATNISITNPEKIFSYLNGEHVIAIDELQFFHKGIVGVIEKLIKEGKYIIGAGLDLDFRGETFGSMGDLLARADEVKKFHAYCDVCGDIARYTQKFEIIDGKKVPAKKDSDQVEVGDSSYGVRCFRHHELP